MLLEFSVRLIAFLLVPLVTLSLGGCDRQKPESPQGGATAAADAGAGAFPAAHPTGRLDRSKAGTPVPSVTFQDPDGQPATLADFGGKPLLVNLWATWCAPCITEMPTLDALAARDGEVKVLTVSQDLDGREKVDAFFAKNGYSSLEAYLDPEMQLMMELKVDTLPTTILYDAKGKEVWRMTGMEDWRAKRAADLIKEAG
jgi:thiol-disulfide isomerase/thioredoxin